MIKKMEISCQNCSKKYKNRSCYEKHRNKCGNECMDMIIALTKRVEQLEKQLGQNYEEPDSSFQEFIKTDFSSLMKVDWDDKVMDIYLENARRIINDTTCVRKKDKIYVYENGWIPLKESDCIEIFARSIQTKLLKMIIQDENYFINITKVTGVDIKKVANSIKKLS